MKVDLREKSGLPIVLDLENLKVIFNTPLSEVNPDIRTVIDAQPYLYEKGLSEPEELYYMYRGVSLPEHELIWKENNLRYDLTLLRPDLLGREFNKTVGHYHPLVPGTLLTYPEIYEVLYGEAYYLLQKVSFLDGKQYLERAVVVIAQPGEKVIIPPGWGHITINPDDEEPLLMANITADGFKSIYEPMKEANGGAFFLLSDGYWEENGRYDGIDRFKMDIIRATPLDQEGIFLAEPLYALAVKSPQTFKFLNEPQGFASWWEKFY